MVDAPIKSKAEINQWLKWMIGFLLLYWGVLAVILPVNNWDSHTYNLARLAVIEKMGFWQGCAWNSIRQSAFPWVFDAVHFPFLKLGWGTALPSYISFLGLTIIGFNLVAERFGKGSAYLALLILLTMPTLMMQATTTKNDLVVVYCFAVWFYAIVRYQRTAYRACLFWCALSLSFASGCKTSAIPICIILFTVSLIRIITNKKALFCFLLFTAFLLPLFCSLETYCLNWFLYHHPLGPSSFISRHSNSDGFLGAAANVIRYYIGNISFGIPDFKKDLHLTSISEQICRIILHFLHLKNVGYSADVNDQNLQFLRNGWDSGSDFGVFASLAMIYCSFRCLRPCMRNPIWILSIVGFIQLGINAWFIAWMPWNTRFLCGSFIAFTVAGSIAFSRYSVKHPLIFRSTSVFIALAAIANPIQCRDRNPISIAKSITHRSEIAFDQRRVVLPVYYEVIELKNAGATKWSLVAGSDSWVLPFLEIPNIQWNSTPNWDQIQASDSKCRSYGDRYVLVLNRSLPDMKSYDLVKSFPDSTYILRTKQLN
jgi:hypothetical protein